MSTTPEEILKTYWGHEHFRPQQAEIIQSVLLGKDTIALLPTGGGKSICFQIPGLLLEGITIVISPLIALMNDQVSQLKMRGVKAMAIPSGTSYQDLDALLDNCIYGNYKFIYLSPERLQQPIVQERIKQMPVSLIAVDEAHCISQWGHDFRPSYIEIFQLRDLHPEVPIIAVTATATEKVLKDIKKHLQLTASATFKSSYERKNLTYTIIESQDKYNDLVRALTQTANAVIIYVRSRKATIQLSQFLNERGITTQFYHGGLSAKQRNLNFKDWIENKAKVMIGTSAFGMGIDKADVSLVVHFNIPDSVENYFQEAGRAGRDGNPAKALLFYNENDTLRLQSQFLDVIPDVAFVKEVYRRLCNYFTIAYGEGQGEVVQLNFSEFCDTYKLKAITTYNALTLLDRNAVIVLDKTFSQRATISFKVSDVMLTYYLIKNKQLDTIVKAVLRTYGGIFEQVTTINYSVLATKSETTIDAVHKTLLRLHADDIIAYNHKSFDTAITFLQPREDDRTINTISPHIKAQAAAKHLQIEHIKTYIHQKKSCRSQWLLNYFGESTSLPCGHCDICKTHTHTLQPKEIADRIVEALRLGEQSSKDLERITTDKESLFTALNALLSRRKIKLTPHNTYILS